MTHSRVNTHQTTLPVYSHHTTLYYTTHTHISSYYTTCAHTHTHTHAHTHTHTHTHTILYYTTLHICTHHTIHYTTLHIHTHHALDRENTSDLRLEIYTGAILDKVKPYAYISACKTTFAYLKCFNHVN